MHRPGWHARWPLWYLAASQIGNGGFDIINIVKHNCYYTIKPAMVGREYGVLYSNRLLGSTCRPLCVGGLGSGLLLLVRLLAQGLDGADWLVQLTTSLAVVW